ncbi:MAG: SPOR domain-containing protein [Pseudohongiellaceae bacterium]
MRTVILLLLVTNLGFLAWNMFQPPWQDLVVGSDYGARAVPGITLLAERTPEPDIPTEPERPASRVIGPQSGGGAMNCIAIGLFPTLDDAFQFIAQARELGFNAELAVDGPMLDPQYRVFLPPAESREMATTMLDELNRRALDQGMTLESYLVTRGELENGVALGVFNQADNATEIVRQVASLGFEVRISEVPQTDGDISVHLKNLENERLGDTLWSQLILDRPYLDQSQNVCETIAQGRQFP